MFNTRLTVEQPCHAAIVPAPPVQHDECHRYAQRTGTLVKWALQQLGSIPAPTVGERGAPAGQVHMDPWVSRDSSRMITSDVV